MLMNISLKKRTLLVLLSGLTATFTLAQQQPLPEWQSQYAVGLNKLAPHTYVWPYANASDIDIRPSSCIIRRLVKVLRTIIGILHPMEFPLSIETHIKRRLFIPSRLFNVGSVGVRPYVCVKESFLSIMYG